MRCPNCQNQATSFGQWLLCRKSSRTCQGCGSRLRLKHGRLFLGFHGLLGGAWAVSGLPLWVLVAVLPLTGIVYPWFFAQYECSEQPKHRAGNAAESA